MIINKDENAIISELSSLYERRGYKRYKLGCFEEYSLYRDNKDFLIAKNVITFSDLDGRLMAMRPDVTLSIIRHTDVESGRCEKYYYNEKVYRQASGSKNYGEISQTGVEIIGDIDMASTVELTILICRTLATVSDDYILDISHMGFTEGLLEGFGENKAIVSEYLKKKNLHDFSKLSKNKNFTDKQAAAFNIAASACGEVEDILEKAESVSLNDKMKCAVEELKTLYSILKEFGFEKRVNINFSSTVNADYYNGVTFNGYINGIPHCVLSGGRYDKLLEKLEKNGGAIGFAIYLGEIERYFKKKSAIVDVLIVYDDSTQKDALIAAEKRIEAGESVKLSRSEAADGNYKKVINLIKGGYVK